MQDNPYHPEWRNYQLVHELEFDVLKDIYGTTDAEAYLNVSLVQQSSVVTDSTKQQQQPSADVNNTALPVELTTQSSSISSCPAAMSSSKTTLSSFSGQVVHYDYDGAILPCPNCVKDFKFATGGIGDFQQIPLKIKAEVRKEVVDVFVETDDIIVRQLSRINHSGLKPCKITANNNNNDNNDTHPSILLMRYCVEMEELSRKTA